MRKFSLVLWVLVGCGGEVSALNEASDAQQLSAELDGTFQDDSPALDLTVPQMQPPSAAPALGHDAANVQGPWSNVTKDDETHACGDYLVSGWVTAARYRDDAMYQFKYIGAQLWRRLNGGGWEVVPGMDYRLQIRTAAEGGSLLWSSGARTDSTYGQTYWFVDQATRAASHRLPERLFDKGARPYVRFEIGKDGDGKKNCVFYVFPFERG